VDCGKSPGKVWNGCEYKLVKHAKSHKCHCTQISHLRAAAEKSA
jgi:hypothetical protein